jgi:hypothetical protein
MLAMTSLKPSPPLAHQPTLKCFSFTSVPSIFILWATKNFIPNPNWNIQERENLSLIVIVSHTNAFTFNTVRSGALTMRT